MGEWYLYGKNDANIGVKYDACIQDKPLEHDHIHESHESDDGPSAPLLVKGTIPAKSAKYIFAYSIGRYWLGYVFKHL